MIYLDEDTVRALLAEAISTARRTTPDNVSDEAVIQWTLKEEFVDGRWQSTYFQEKKLQVPTYPSADEIV